MTQKIFCLLLLCALLAAPQAKAASILNLTENTQAIVLSGRGQPVVVEIRPWGKYWEIGPIRAKYRNQEVYIEEDTEYAIWPGGVFGPQRVNRHLTRGSF